MAPTALERVQGFVLPAMLILAAAVFFLQTVIITPKLLVTNYKEFKNRAFARLWLAVGKKLGEDVPEPLDQLLANLRGIVLDVGPGAGDQLVRYSRPEMIDVIYGAEPGVGLHSKLREHAEDAGLGGKYRILSCGAEPESLFPALSKAGLLGKQDTVGDGIFDEVVCIRVLCGVPRLQETVACLYRCIKPGGRLIVCEHVVSDEHQGGSRLAVLFQQFYMMLGWSFWTGGCELTRDTTAVIMKSAEADGGWDKVKLVRADEWSLIPTTVGYLVKKS